MDGLHPAGGRRDLAEARRVVAAQCARRVLLYRMRERPALGRIRAVQQVHAAQLVLRRPSRESPSAILRLRLVVRDDLAGDLRDRGVDCDGARSARAAVAQNAARARAARRRRMAQRRLRRVPAARADRAPIAVACRAGVARLHLPARSVERGVTRGIGRVDSRRSRGRSSRPARQSARGRAGVRPHLGILELLVAHELRGAGAAECEDFRDADRGLRRLPAVRAGVLRHVRVRPTVDLAWSVAADLVIIAVSFPPEGRKKYEGGGTDAMTTTTSLEREIKLRFDSVEEARRAVLGAGATPLLGRRLQEDSLLDSDDEELRRRRCVLRVRVENGKSRLTFKGPVQASAMSVREEYETVVGDGDILLRVLLELGLHVWFRYEKYREEFSHEDVTVAVDETPVGVFVEIEGSDPGIMSMAEALGRTSADYIVDSYRTLFLQLRDQCGLAGTDMVFEES
ncbi:MAG: hypothetical protein DMF86_24555 [Acidobacteria bacterium]|nr:MAG: hypothetical protein DMF86_24555 [Acidobacteriota bacterium]